MPEEAPAPRPVRRRLPHDATMLAIFKNLESAGWSPSTLGSGRYLRAELPVANETRQVLVQLRDAEALNNHDLSTVRGVRDYAAIFDTASGNVEAAIVSGDTRFGGLIRQRIWRLPGTEILDEGPDLPDEEEARREPRRWRIRVEDRGRSIELSPASPLADAIVGGQVTMKLEGFGVSTEDAAGRLLRGLGSSFLFDLDVLYSAGVQLRRQSDRERDRLGRHVEPADARSPLFPRNEYVGEPLALYEYARSATGLPLLQFLAYYQALEYFFPTFAREETVRSLRGTLLHPKFDPTSDVAVNRLIALAAPALRAGVGEREQLRATVRAITSVDELEAFVTSRDDYRDLFCNRKQAIKGAGQIVLQGGQNDLRDQIADRVYGIRNRVVHTKQDGGGAEVELLLPSSHEAESLYADIALLRLLAQNALVTRAKRAT